MNPHEAHNRERKAGLLAVVLEPVLQASTDGSVAELAEALDDDAWGLAAKKAKVNPPSEATRELVVTILRNREVAAQGFTSRPGPPASSQESVNGLPRTTEGGRAASVVGLDRAGAPPVGAYPTLFDAAQTSATTDAAIKQVGSNADPAWRLRALNAIRRVAETNDTFVVDACWCYVEEPAEPRAMGAVMRQAQRQGLIAKTNEFRPSERVTSHRNPRVVWRSLIRHKQSA